MSILIDILLVAIAIVNIIVFTKRGFLKSVFKFGRKIIALILAVTVGPIVGKLLYNAFLYNWIYGLVEPKISAGVSKIEELPFLIRQLVPANISLEGAADQISHTVSSPAATLISNILGYILVFVASVLLLRLITPLIDFIGKLPIVRNINTVFGFILGIVASFFLLVIVTFLLGAIIKVFAGDSVFAKIVFDSWIFKLFTGITL